MEAAALRALEGAVRGQHWKTFQTRIQVTRSQSSQSYREQGATSVQQD